MHRSFLMKSSSAAARTGCMPVPPLFDHDSLTAVESPAKQNPAPSKLAKKVVRKKAMPMASEAEDDPMTDMFGTSPFAKPAPTTRHRAEKATTPSKPKPAPKERTPVLSKAIKRIIDKPAQAQREHREAPRPRERLVRHEDDYDHDHGHDHGSVETDEQPGGKAYEQLERQFEELRERFEKLSMLKHSSAERLLEEYKKAAATRDAATQSLIEGLRSENALLKERLDTQIATSSRESNVSTLSTATSAGASMETASIIRLYKSLCGLEVLTLAEDKWACTLEGRTGSYAFELELDEDEAEFTYTPVSTSKTSAVWDRLPSYLKEEIVFGEGYLQSFFWRALNFLMTQ